MTTKISKKMLIIEINQIPDENNLEVYKLLHFFRSSLTQKHSKKNFRDFLKNAPVWSSREISELSKARQWMNEWMTKRS